MPRKKAKDRKDFLRFNIVKFSLDHRPSLLVTNVTKTIQTNQRSVDIELFLKLSPNHRPSQLVTNVMKTSQTNQSSVDIELFQNSHQIIDHLLPKGESRNEGNAVFDRQLDEPLPLP